MMDIKEKIGEIVARSYLDYYKRENYNEIEIFRREIEVFAKDHPNGDAYYRKSKIYELKNEIKDNHYGGRWVVQGCNPINKEILKDMIESFYGIFEYFNKQNDADSTKWIKQQCEGFFKTMAKLKYLESKKNTPFKDVFVSPYKERYNEFIDMLKDGSRFGGGFLSSANRWIGNKESIYTLIESLREKGIIDCTIAQTKCVTIAANEFEGGSVAKKKPGSKAIDDKELFDTEINLLKAKIDQNR